jgi:all-trans-retinol 13,14-reductase
MGITTKAPGDVVRRLGFVAWIVYELLASNGYWTSAGLMGVALTVVVVATQYRGRAIKLMDCTSLSYFVVATILIVGGRAGDLQRNHQVVVWGLFAVVAWITLAVRAPFTLQYTRPNTSPAIWDNPDFLRMNRNMTAVWAAIFTLGSVLGEVVRKYGHPLLFGLIVPMAAMVLGVLFSLLYPRRYGARFVAAEAERNTPGHRAAAEQPSAIGNARSL